jgi:hypothetical protein
MSRTDRTPGPPRGPSRQWLLFVHQLPSNPSNLRVQTWRRLQQLGALPVKQTVYVLPDTPDAREDFEWLKAEITGAGGEASVFAADTVDAWTDEALVQEFTRTRQDAYRALAREIEQALSAMSKQRGGRARSRRRPADGFRQRLGAIEQIDFFGAPGRDRVAMLLAKIEAIGADGRSASRPGSKNARDYRGRVWVTRRRPGVDRMASAWLIRRFIDSQARFAFADSPAAVAGGALPFDMFGVEFSHHGDDCTFETLRAMFGIGDAVVGRIAAIVHDLDMKDARFGATEALTIASVIEGLQLSIEDDPALLIQGMVLFESLYRSFAQAAPPAHSRRLAPSRRRAAASKRTG